MTFGDVVNDIKNFVGAYVFTGLQMIFAGCGIIIMQVLAFLLMIPLIAVAIYCVAYFLMGIMKVFEFISYGHW